MNSMSTGIGRYAWRRMISDSCSLRKARWPRGWRCCAWTQVL